MARKFLIPISGELNLDTWRKRMPDVVGDKAVLFPVFYDMRRLNKLSNDVLEYLKEVLKEQMPPAPSQQQAGGVVIQRTLGGRKGPLDEERLILELGPDWVETYRKARLEWDEFRPTLAGLK